MKKEKLAEEVAELLKNVLDLIRSHKWENSTRSHKKMWDEMVAKAVELHKIVKPKHHKYMIENRGYSPDDPAFYNHVHPIEDLLKFIKDPHANDDPEDKTIDHVFTIDVFTRRWGHDDQYSVKRTKKGWEILHDPIGGACNKKGQPYLFEILNHDNINYPEELPGYMEWLWIKAEENGLTHAKVQAALNKLAKWVSLCEKNSPKDLWLDYK